MATNDRNRLRELMEELAKVEGNIFFLRTYSVNNPLNTLEERNNPGAQPPKNKTTSWIIGTGAALLLFPPAALYTGYRAYHANKAYNERLEEWKGEQNARNNLVEMVSMQEKRREELLGELRQLCTDNPALDGDYWWKDKKMNPAVAGNVVQTLLPGSTPSDAEWQFGLFHHLWTVEDGADLFLMDMKQYAVNIYAEDALEMLNPANSKVLYKNDDLFSTKPEGFKLTHLYAYDVQPVQEVTKSTVRTAVDKNAERAAYQRKLDIQESILNGIGSRNFMSDEEMQMTGRMGMGEYVDRSLVRGMYEADFEAKLSKKGDYEEHSTYSKGFHGLSQITLSNCADVLISLEPKTNGQCAAIMVPRTEQKIMRLLVRSNQKDNPFVGRLEPYGEIPEFEMFDTGDAPSIQMAVDKLLSNPDMIQMLHLKPRDILEKKPENMDEYEYTYLIWNDNPQGRVS